MQISQADRTQVEAAIRSAEERTGADFVCVLAPNASRYAFYPLAWASLLALAAPWPCLWLTTWPFTSVLLVQLGVFVIALPVFGLPPLRRLLVPRRVQRATAHRAAAEQFLIRNLASTPTRRGVLLFLSCEEHYARVLADDAADAAVSQDHWRGAVDRMIAEARHGRHAAGFIAALDHCADGLGASRPAQPSEPANALPDRFVVLD